MKTWVTIFIAAAVAHSAAEEEPRRTGTGPEVLPKEQKGPAGDLPSDELLKELRKKKGLEPKVVKFKPQGYSLAELSQFVGDSERFVMLPKGCVIHCPEGMSERIMAKPQGRMMVWSEFLVANRNWITTREVTMPQVRGEAAIAEADRKSFAAAGKMVIATFRGNPVTVLTPPTLVEKTQ